MEALKFAVLLLVFVFVQVFGALGNPLSRQEEDGETWGLDNWQEYPEEGALSNRLAELIKRSKSHQFHGLMGRSLGSYEPVRAGGKRNKGAMFVGLMGRRNLSGDVDEQWNSDFN
ncbi:tachykinin-4 isoform X2 [Cynoglossus semilaevis]|uniref:tachykinin-4 isoform X2 n=1 Tax=Cynoglossus semilaevis TaxID=244447 RepID=UPI000497676E|nr:protachykinin-like isoform X2 [Cynoglossus semilaevis]